MNKLAVLEGILFVVGDEGITLERICEVYTNFSTYSKVEIATAILPWQNLAYKSFINLRSP